MKKSILIPLCLLLSFFIVTPSAMGETLFGPKQYVRTKGAADVYTDTFSATSGEATLSIENGMADGSNRVSSAQISLNGVEIFGTEDFSQGVYILEAPVNLVDNNTLTVKIKKGKQGSFLTIEITRGVQIPTVDISANPETIEPGQSSTLSWTSSSADSCVIEPGIGPVDVNGSTAVSPTDTTMYTITATGPGGTATDSTTVTVTTYPPPTVDINADPDTIQAGESSTLTWTSTSADSCIIEPDIGSVDVNGSTSVSPTETTTYTITATGPGGTATDQAVVTVEGQGDLFPDGSFAQQYQDLIPPDATAEYDPKRFSLITGIVQDLNASPITDVSVSIHSHPEYGAASTDIAGQFTIPVDGGGVITIVYQKEGLITAHRKAHVSWNEIATAETVRMITQDTASTTFTFDGNPDTVVAHQSTEVTDTFGSRSSTMVFTGDNTAYEVDAEGNIIQELTTITTRATEFTTPDSMPAILPPTSAYTYCAELSIDEAERVKFDFPVTHWVNNFLGFDVGTIVPVGYYDRDKGFWVPSDNGIVAKLLDTDSNGIVDALDATGDDQPDDLNNNQSFNDEVTGLDDPVKYPPGSTFWRVEINHFTPVDLNWPIVPPSDAIEPNPEGEPTEDEQKDEEDDCERPVNSFLEERSRIFHEDIPIPGTDLTLHYASNRVGDYNSVITIPASGDSVPASLKRIIVRLKVAGRTFEEILDPLPNQKAEFVWDGLDHLGKPMRGRIPAYVGVGFVYDGVYAIPESFAQAFGQAGNGSTGIMTREERTLSKGKQLNLNRVVGTIAGGWTISSHHYMSNYLVKGDGTILRNAINGIHTVAGTGTDGYSGDGGPATEAQFHLPEGIEFDAEGNLYIADFFNHRIRRIDRNGIVTTVAGNGHAGFGGDGRLATRAKLETPTDVAFDATGNLYIADQGNQRIRMVDKDGIITTIAGNGSGPCSGDGGLAIEAGMGTPKGIALDAAGNLYIADWGCEVVRKVDPNGIITTVAGTGSMGYSGDGGPATEAQIRGPWDIVLDSAGNLYIADCYNQRVRKVDQSGIITTVAGTGSIGYSGDGGPATEARLNYPVDVAVDASDNLYIVQWSNECIRMVDQQGSITTVAGTGTTGDGGDGGPATQAQFDSPQGIAFNAAGNLYIADTYNDRVRKVALVDLEDTIFTENTFGYVMASAGTHLRTIDLDTGITLFEFGYDLDNNLISITDQFNNQITIQRDGNGVPTAIVSPDGVTSSLTVDANNHLTRITYPDSGFYEFTYTPGGLMTVETDPENNQFDHTFDSNGRLTDIYDQEGGHWNYTRTTDPNGDILTEVLSAEGNLTSYLDHTYSTGEYTSIITDPTAADTLFTRSSDGLTVNKTLPCGMDLSFKYGLDSEYKFRYVKEMTESTPSTLEKVTLRDKTYQDTDSDDIPDLITQTVTVNGKPTTIENNVLQSQKTITSPEGRTVTTHYDPNNLLTTSLSIPGLNATNYGYDTRGRLTSINNNTRQTTFVYNAQGFLDSITDPENHTTSYTYDEVGRVIRVDRPDITSVWFDYDNNGNMTVLTNPSTINHGFGYNGVNLKASYQTPLSGSYSYLYDRDRRPVQTNFPSGDQIANVYDNTRLVQIQTPEGNIDFSYLCGTKVGSIANGTETIMYGYDGKLVTSETLSGTLNQSLSYGYNNDFNLTSFTYGGGTVNYTYDNDGLLTGAGNFTITRNTQNGLPEAVSGGALNLSRTFNGYGEVEGQDFTVNGSSLTSWNLGHDDNGRITDKAETINGDSSNYIYTYDPMGRLLTVTKDSTLVEEYQYGTNGTRTYEMNALRGVAGRSFTYSDEDHLLTAGDITYQYNVDGFLTTKTEGTDVTTYDYSYRGELLGVTLPDGKAIEYIHDPLGRRIAKMVNGVTTEKYLWKGLTRLLAVYDGNETLIMRFEYADRRMPVAMTQGGSTYYLTYDQVGSLRVVADASGNVLKKINYDSFGNITVDTDPQFTIPFGFAGGLHDSPFGFAGGLHDRDTGLVRFGYRDYDPDTGRWTAKDPIIFAGGDTDLYGYCLSDPINAVDPSGKFFLWRLLEAWGQAETQQRLEESWQGELEELRETIPRNRDAYNQRYDDCIRDCKQDDACPTDQCEQDCYDDYERDMQSDVWDLENRSRELERWEFLWE